MAAYDLMCEVIGELTGMTSFLKVWEEEGEEEGEEGVEEDQAREEAEGAWEREEEDNAPRGEGQGAEEGRETERGRAALELGQGASRITSSRSSGGGSGSRGNGNGIVSGDGGSSGNSGDGSGDSGDGGNSGDSGDSGNGGDGGGSGGGSYAFAAPSWVPASALRSHQLVGWANRLASARCMDSGGGDECVRSSVKLTPHTFSIARWEGVGKTVWMRVGCGTGMHGDECMRSIEAHAPHSHLNLLVFFLKNNSLFNFTLPLSRPAVRTLHTGYQTCLRSTATPPAFHLLGVSPTPVHTTLDHSQYMFSAPFLPCSADLAHRVSGVLEVYSHTSTCPHSNMVLLWKYMTPTLTPPPMS